MAEQNILFICEGLEDEPGFIKKLMSVSYPSLKYRVYSYKTTIHTLASKLDHDYPDFNSGEVDIQLILKEMESDEETRKMLSSDFSDIILAFDFDPHHDHPRFDTVMKMLEFYVDSTDMGKLYINYPMMQSFKHFSALPDLAYLEKCASPFGYKKLVGLESRFSDLSGYRFETFVKIAVLNIRKVNNILNGSCSLMTADEYKKIDWKEVYGTELELFLNTGETHVLNTLCMFMTDYNVNRFFSLVCKHQEKYYV